ncbi:MAG: GNAT family N-acetyltransferase [Spirochaetaceae bacterium]|nr:GNAT family N-acetyltransferase [Spirochaetaceae bacterium]
MIIRRATAAELAAVGELTLAAYVADGHLSAADDYADELRAAADRDSSAELAVAVDESGALLGTVTFALAGSAWAEISRPGEAEFRMLAVAVTARGRGVGKSLARWCIDRARAQGCTAVAISTMSGMHAAHRIYERLGFVRAPERDWWPSSEVLLIAYHLDLTTGPLEPPRFCPQCRRRMVVQVLPRGWSARCSEHGVLSAT